MATSSNLLSTGSTGDRVARVQLALNGRLSAGARLNVDGVFGPLTTARVKAFQSLKGLRADGIVGQETASRLTISSADFAEVKSSVRTLLASTQASPAVLTRFDQEYQRVEDDRSTVTGGPLLVVGAVVIIAFVAFGAAMIAIAAQAQNRQSADPLAREFARRMAANRPSDLVASAVDEVAGGIEFTARWATDLRAECDKQFPLGPNQCRDQARKVAELTASLIQKAAIIREPGRRGFRYDDLLKGVLKNVRDLVQAMFDLGDCQKCPFLQL